MNKNYLKTLKNIFSENPKSQNFRKFRNVENFKNFNFFFENIFCFVHNFFETKYFPLIFFYVKDLGL